jgi:hypothetical protein
MTRAVSHDDEAPQQWIWCPRVHVMLTGPWLAALGLGMLLDDLASGAAVGEVLAALLSAWFGLWLAFVASEQVDHSG